MSRPRPDPVPVERMVRVAEWAVAGPGEVLLTLGLGSCVAVMLYDPGARLGAMAHVLLPSRSLARDATHPAKFPETAVPLLIGELIARGGARTRLLAKLAGGASMFAQLMSPGSIQMGERNIVAVRSALRAAGIPITAEAVGGERGRSVRFFANDGRVEVRSVGADATVI
jgi:chemotaxis protein CheD